MNKIKDSTIAIYHSISQLSNKYKAIIIREFNNITQ